MVYLLTLKRPKITLLLFCRGLMIMTKIFTILLWRTNWPLVDMSRATGHCWQGAYVVASVTYCGYKWNKVGWEFRLHILILVKYHKIFTSCRVLVNKTNRRTEFQIYWYYYSTCFGQPFCPSSGVLSRTSALVHFMQFWWPFATRSRMELQFHPAPGSKRLSKLHKMYQCRCTAKNSWWWAERLPETCRVVIPIKLEFSASVGFIHKEFVTMHGHTILKFL